MGVHAQSLTRRNTHFPLSSRCLAGAGSTGRG
jgi:hypothetical protein